MMRKSLPAAPVQRFVGPPSGSTSLRAYYVHQTVLASPDFFDLRPGNARRFAKPRNEYVRAARMRRDSLDTLDNSNCGNATSLFVAFVQNPFERHERRWEFVGFAAFIRFDQLSSELRGIVVSTGFLTLPPREMFLPSRSKPRATIEQKRHDLWHSDHSSFKAAQRWS